MVTYIPINQMLMLIYSLIAAQKSKEEAKEKEMELFSKLYSEWKGPNKYSEKSYKTIPKFYFKACH